MFAVFKTGGKQYKVVSGDILLVEKLSANQGDKVRFNHVLALGDKAQTVGTPVISGAFVDAEILSQTKGEKTINFVKRRRKHSSQRKKGHRQNLTVLKVLDIKSDKKLSSPTEVGFEIIGKAKVVGKSKDVNKLQDKNEAVVSAGNKNEQEKIKEPSKSAGSKSTVEKKYVAVKENKPIEKKAKATKKVKTAIKATEKPETKNKPVSKQKK
mgnify:CR=1 FL=1